MNKKYKIISVDLQKNLIEFLDEIQFDAAKSKNEVESMHVINFCSWAIKELLNSYDGYLKEEPKKKSRDDVIDDTFMDWKLPEMDDDEFEKLVGQFDAFLRGWEKEYNKKNPKKPIKKRTKKPFKPHIDDVIEYCSLDEIKDMLKDDPELSDYERFELYYDERERRRKIKESRKAEKKSKPLDKVLKELNIKPSDWKPEDDKKNPPKK